MNPYYTKRIQKWIIKSNSSRPNCFNCTMYFSWLIDFQVDSTLEILWNTNSYIFFHVIWFQTNLPSVTEWHSQHHKVDLQLLDHQQFLEKSVTTRVQPAQKERYKDNKLIRTQHRNMEMCFNFAFWLGSPISDECDSL